ncbi:adenylate/guanylate cyclase domain-containing protein [Nocardioides sp. R-C-SC26]|uniref:adenylate/guanylate cyclase domain-containing protein n=1 Tax=Nocardioides sp. R-C-SC26 TaxID=2870414 RepID=UPI001E4AEE84|nr:adenylate/guanylate cyclase domain-containing protein [Nocardioides sp. R-C-SC26]
MTSRRRRRTRTPFGSRLLGPADQSPRALRVRVQLLLTALLITANLVGAGAVFVSSAIVIPAPDANRGTLLSLAIGVPTYVAFAVVVGAVFGTTTALRALRWATTSGVEPTPRERVDALRVPLRLTVMQGWLWLGAVALFVGLALVLQPERATSTGLSIAVAGSMVCAVSYLFSQFALRPVAARALAAAPFTSRPPGAGVGVRMVIFWVLGTGVPMASLTVTALLALTLRDTSATRLAVTMLVIGAVVLCFGLLITVLNARSVVEPVRSVRDALLDVERGDLSRTVAVYDGTELGQLQSGFNQMVHGLREREHLRDLFGRHVGQEVAQAAAAGEVELGGEERSASVLFVDLVGSTTYATEHSPTEVVAMLNRFFGVVVDEVDRHHGLVNKFIGDAVLAVFGVPIEQPDHASAALAAAREMARRLAEEVPEVGVGIGVATGEVVAGNVGHQSRFEYTVIGDAVNSAARLTDLAKDVPGGILAAAAAVEASTDGERARWQPDADVVLRGRAQATSTYRLADG